MLPALLPVLLAFAPVADADFQPWRDFPEAKFKGTRLWRDPASGAYCYVTAHSRVDADGAPNAYHPDDLGRRRPPFLGLDNPANAGWPGTRWWNSVLVPDPQNPLRPYRQVSGPFRGYFVAMTSLKVRGGTATDPATYVDSTKVPYTVLPGSSFPRRAGTGAPGDVGFAWNLANGKSTAFVIGDTGGGSNARLGEGSIALFRALGGTNPDARNGSGVAPGKMRYVVFPGSRRTLGWPADEARIDALARELLGRLGGMSALAVCGQ
jgi:hypothetical protein